MDGRYAVAIIEPDPRLRMMLGARLPAAKHFDSIDQLTRGLPGHAVVAVFGPNLVSPFGFEQVHRLASRHPMLGPVVAAYELSTDLLQHALRAGARDAVEIDTTGDAVAEAVARVGEAIGAPGRAVATVPANAPEPRANPGRVIAVFSTKGGVGKTTVATNVGAAMARLVDEPVCLMDADMQFGDVAVMLGLPPDHTVADAAASIHFADAELMRNLVSRHDSGLMVLPAPAEPMLSSQIAPEEMTEVCNGLRGISDFVLVDVPTSFDDTTLALLEVADDVLLVASMDIPSIKNLKIGMQALDLATIAGPKIRLVLNRANAQVKLDVREVEHVLGLRAAFPIPYDLAVPRAVNAGVPVVMQDPRGAASRAFEQLARSLLGPAVPRGRIRDGGRRAKKSGPK